MLCKGGCHCGSIRFEVEIDPQKISICHCTDCQKLTGSAFRVTAQTSRNNFRLLTGIPKVYAKTGESGHISLQYFCAECGSPLYRAAAHPDDNSLGIRVGSLDRPAPLAPGHQSWRRSALSWVFSLSCLPGSDRERPEDQAAF